MYTSYEILVLNAYGRALLPNYKFSARITQPTTTTPWVTHGPTTPAPTPWIRNETSTTKYPMTGNGTSDFH